MKSSDKTHATAGDNRLAEAHVSHAVVDQHLDIVDLNNLIPHVWQQTQRQVTMSNGALVRTLLFCALYIHMYPLVVECGISKEIDAI